MLSASRGRIPSRTTSRSTTASMSWVLVLASLGSSPLTSTISPSTRARISPARRIAWKASACCPLRPAHQRRQDQHLPSLAHRQHVATICSGVWRRIGRPQRGQCGVPSAGVEQAQVVVDLGDRPDGAPRAGRAGLLVDRNGRRQAVDQIDVGPLELVEELAGVARKALDVPPLTLGVDGVEGQRALARSAHPREHHEPVARQVDVDPLEVVHPRSPDPDGVAIPRVAGPRTPPSAIVTGASPGSARSDRDGDMPGPAG